MALPKVTLETWNALEPALHSFTPKTKELAFAVLVEGIPVSKVARDHELTRQTVYEAVWRFAAVLEQSESSQLYPVYEWLPRDLAEEVKRMAEPYKNKPKSKE